MLGVCLKEVKRWTGRVGFKGGGREEQKPEDNGVKDSLVLLEM